MPASSSCARASGPRPRGMHFMSNEEALSLGLYVLDEKTGELIPRSSSTATPIGGEPWSSRHLPAPVHAGVAGIQPSVNAGAS